MMRCIAGVLRWLSVVDYGSESMHLSRSCTVLYKLTSVQGLDPPMQRTKYCSRPSIELLVMVWWLPVVRLVPSCSKSYSRIQTFLAAWALRIRARSSWDWLSFVLCLLCLSELLLPGLGFRRRGILMGKCRVWRGGCILLVRWSGDGALK